MGSKQMCSQHIGTALPALPLPEGCGLTRQVKVALICALWSRWTVCHLLCICHSRCREVLGFPAPVLLDELLEHDCCHLTQAMLGLALQQRLSDGCILPPACCLLSARLQYAPCFHSKSLAMHCVSMEAAAGPQICPTAGTCKTRSTRASPKPPCLDASASLASDCRRSAGSAARSVHWRLYMPHSMPGRH